MGCKYTIRFMRNGTCDFEFDRQTNNILVALWYLLTLSIKYPIVDFQIRRGYTPCEKCNADWCEKSPAFARKGCATCAHERWSRKPVTGYTGCRFYKNPCRYCDCGHTNHRPKWYLCLFGRLITCILVAAALMIAIPNIAHAATLGTSEPEPQDMVVIKATDAEIDMLAQLVWAEARGVDSTMEKAAVVWCVLNRVDNGAWGSTITDVVTARHQFAYDADAPITDELHDLAMDVVQRWINEKTGRNDVWRVLPKEYVYFAGRGGHNWFRTWYRGGSGYWDWSLPDPYTEEDEQDG